MYSTARIRSSVPRRSWEYRTFRSGVSRLPTVTRAVGVDPAPRSSDGSMEKRFRPKSRSASRSSPTDSESRPAARVAAPAAASWAWLARAWVWVRFATSLSSWPARRARIWSELQRRVRGEGRGDAVERAADVQRHPVGADLGLRLDVERAGRAGAG